MSNYHLFGNLEKVEAYLLLQSMQRQVITNVSNRIELQASLLEILQAIYMAWHYKSFLSYGRVGKERVCMNMANYKLFRGACI